MHNAQCLIIGEATNSKIYFYGENIMEIENKLLLCILYKQICLYV